MSSTLIKLLAGLLGLLISAFIIINPTPIKVIVGLLGLLVSSIILISIMSPRLIKIIAGLFGLLIFATFIIGLSHSISTGFAGFEGGLPFAIIAGFVICLAAYDFYDDCVRNKSADIPTNNLTDNNE